MNTNLKKIAPEADGVVKDGQAIRVRMSVMDAAVQQELADKFAPKPFVADHHRPNSGILTDEQKKAMQDRIAASDKKLSDAWRNPAPLYMPPAEAKTAPVADTKLAPVVPVIADKVGIEQLDAIQADNQANYNKRLENAWRNPINHATGAK